MLDSTGVNLFGQGDWIDAAQVPALFGQAEGQIVSVIQTVPTMVNLLMRTTPKRPTLPGFC
jgi:hypothetical protein